MSEAVLQRLRSALNDRYLVERELGEGGAATVYLARDIKHERNVAIKVFKPELAETLGVERFTREIRTAANLSNPHILTVLDSGSADGLLYYVMPFAEGESLRARIAREGGLPVVDVIRVMREVADALSTAHAAGVVHRDIKPDNILLSGRHALVADFGVAKAISESTGKNLVTTVGVALGTPSYMAPEQAAADPHVDHRADIYALGIVGYEMLVGEPPFVRRSPHEVLAAHVTEPAPPVSKRRQSVPPALEAIIAKCLAKAPGDRFQSARDVETELERVMTPTAGMSPAAGMQPTSATAAVTGRTPPPRVVRWAAIAAVAAAGAWFAVTKFGGRGAAGDKNVVAVFPFDVSGPPDAQYLSEGLVSILEASFTGEGGPRAVASQTMIAQWKRHGGASSGLTDEEALTIGRAVGAGQILRGSVVATGRELVLSASLTPAGGRAVQARVTGSADSVASLAANLAAQLLALGGGQTAERATSLQSVPQAALRAYLEGQSLFRAAKYDESLEQFERAIAIDSTLAVAAMWIGQVRGMNPSTFSVPRPGGNANQLAFRHKDRLAPGDLKLLELQSPELFGHRMQSVRELLVHRERLAREIPDRVEAWFLVGDLYLHNGEGAGLTRGEALARTQEAFATALRLDPGLEVIRQHIADAYLWYGELAAYARIVDSLKIEKLHHRLARVLIGGDSLGAGALLARQEISFSDLIPLAFVAGLAGSPRIADSLTRAIETRSGSVIERRAALRWARTGYDMGGRPSEVARVQAKLRALEADGRPEFPEEDVFGAIFGGGDRAAAQRAISSLRAMTDLSTPLGRRRAGRAAWHLGLWSNFTGDSVGFLRSVRDLDELGALRDTVAGVSEFNRLRAVSLRLLATPTLQLATQADSAIRDGFIGSSALEDHALNLIVARAWERLGATDRAAAAIRRIGNAQASFSSVTSVAYREKGRMLLAAGDTSEALVAMQSYLRVRAMAEPSQRALDDPIRAKLAELERKKR